MCGSFAFACFAAYLIKLFFYPEGALSYFSALFVVLGVGIPFVFRKPLRKLLKKAYPFLKCVLCVLLLFFTVSFSLMAARLLSGIGTGEGDVYSQDTVFLVYGGALRKTGEVSPTLAGRLDKAAEAMKSSPGSVAIVSGGQGPGEPRTEAEAMREYLIAAGIEEDRITVEDRASNTVENIRFSLPLVEASGKSDLVSVSTYTHTPRIGYLLSREGVSSRFLASGYPDKLSVFPSFVREYLSYVKLFVGA
ncbi:MAG: YdcF family protein [Clostridia bacterium]|nr:YdcF family protein [Clostridia bacterium]